MPLRFPLLLLAMTGSRRSRDEPPRREYDSTEEYPVADRRGRSHGRRREDEDTLEPEQLRGFAFWSKLMFLHKWKIVPAVSAATGVAGYLLGVYGLNARVSAVERTMQQTVAQVEELQRQDLVKFYMLCTLVRRVDPPATPALCGSVSEQMPLPPSPAKPAS